MTSRPLVALFAAASLLALLGMVPGMAWAQPKLYHTRDEALALAFPEDVTRRPVPLELSETLVTAISEQAKVEAGFKDTECVQGQHGGTVVGYACIDNQIGHQRYITYLIRIDHPQGAIAFLEVMEHREFIGNPANYPQFLRRFPGKTIADPLWIGRDFPGITGATQSSLALTGGARKILRLYDLYLKQLPPL